ncbi:MAG TPA: ATP-dependent zinc metalloprotease FtsH, partial [Chitinophagales bacterium]|nr:ATP-dependent zinc metalloprotease FtsH [Chitinophagales bacterium]
MSTEQNNQNKTKPNGNRKFNFYWIYAIIAVILISFQFFPFQGSPVVLKDISTFKDDMLLKGDVNRIVVVNKEYAEIFIKEDSLKKKIYTDDKVPEKGAQYKWIIGDTETFERQLTEWQEGKTSQPVTIMYETRHNILVSLLSWILPFVIILVIWILVMRRVTGGSGMGGGGQIFNIGKSKPQMYDKDTKVNVTFNDVAGLDEAKEEVMEVVDFLKNPKKYTSLGGKIPKGVLLVGPPGTGKTLLAKAMAGEAQVPFFSISGSDFVEMFVGVGASRVRDLFRQAREKAPCVIFIDEIDAIGRARGKNMIQSNDERENTLNQLLVEMDGFGTDKGVIILAATNRPDVLDPALLRPGRFDRQISIDKPDLAGREQIFNVHLKPIKVSPEVDAHKLAVQTPGFAGADIANVCNEAALIAARRGKKFVELQDFNDAIDRVIGGLEKKNKIISQEEKKIVAYHEAGHAICGWYLEYADPLVKVSIVPRGMAALGYAQYLPKEQYLYTKEQLTDMMCMTLGGRAAEDIIFGRISTGAQNDLERITKMSYAMVSIYGMNERIGNISFNDPNMDQRFSKPYSEQTAQAIDEEVKKMIDSAYQRTKKLLNEKRDQLEIIAKELLEKEIIFKADMERLIG